MASMGNGARAIRSPQAELEGTSDKDLDLKVGSERGSDG